MDINELKSYLRVTDNEENNLIDGLQKAAEEFLANEGVQVSYDMKLYSLAVKLLVAHWYDNRMVQSDKPYTNLSYSLDAIVLQLKGLPNNTPSA